MSFLSQLEWRFATKKFDPSKKLSDEILGKIVEAARMAPTSFGLQPFRVFVVTNPETRKEIAGVAWGQSQVTEASHLLVFAARIDVMNRVDEYIELLSSGDEAMKEKFAGMADTMRQFALGLGDNAMAWAAKQAYLALGFAMAAAAELEIDSCPMEGFAPAEVDRILGLPEQYRSVALLPIGYRALGPAYPKARFPKEDLFVNVK